MGVEVEVEVGVAGSSGFLGGYRSLSSRSVFLIAAMRCLRRNRFVGSLKTDITT